MTDGLHDLAPCHVLDGLDEADRARFEAHLADCSPCRAEVAELSETLAAMGNQPAIDARPEIEPGLVDERAALRPFARNRCRRRSDMFSR